MPREPYAMKQLREEILSVAPKATFKHEDVDGFGVYRTIKWDAKTAKKITQVISLVGTRDPRIESVLSCGVIFSAYIDADDPKTFSLPEVHEILHKK